MGNENCTSSTNQKETGQYLDLQLSIKSMAEPEEVEDEERQGSNKEAICEDDPNEMDDDCPRIFNMGGNSEMVLNKVVGNSLPNEDDLLLCLTVFRKDCATRESCSSTTYATPYMKARGV